MSLVLPFVRFDVVDRTLTVLLSGSSPDRLAPASVSRLEPELEREVRELLREPVRAGRSVRAGLLGLEYGVRLLTHPVSADAVLVSTQRLAIRAAFERLVDGKGLTADEREHARLLAGGYSEVSIAWRLGLSLASATSSCRTIFERIGVPNRAALVRRVFGREPADRSELSRFLRQA